ncbi:hypothetical protein CFC21_018141 [Triticum aestivum]|uniref:Uncharacterized protein n=4 Tax=Triticum TaxID=4564 RepID=A0A9R1P0J5_TRITD|nr:hypothetical protein TRIUR3_34074 [Triticum urartu]KAF7002696.1 hypothetical protein CFC21_018141 [Triticum aestivum]VAH34473.1 unnamed protein product [Triticum turgidum subsp. durum]
MGATRVAEARHGHRLCESQSHSVAQIPSLLHNEPLLDFAVGPPMCRSLRTSALFHTGQAGRTLPR